MKMSVLLEKDFNQSAEFRGPARVTESVGVD
jgi:hypothetical protein